MAATERLEYRVTPENRARIERAAELSGELPTVFARTAAEARADAVLREHEAATRVSPEFFDDLLAALDEPAQPSAALAAAFARLDLVVSGDSVV